MKSLLSDSITQKAKHLEAVLTTGQVSAFWSSAIDALQLRCSTQASDPEGSQCIWKDLELLLSFCCDRYDHHFLLILPYPFLSCGCISIEINIKRKQGIYPLMQSRDVGSLKPERWSCLSSTRSSYVGHLFFFPLSLRGNKWIPSHISGSLFIETSSASEIPKRNSYQLRRQSKG